MDAIPTIAEGFAAYEQVALTEAPDHIREFARSVFYAGAGGMLDILSDLIRAAEPRDTDVALVDHLNAEFDDFALQRVLRLIAGTIGAAAVAMLKRNDECGPTSDVSNEMKDWPDGGAT
jgi:hypothetical protein